MQSVNNLWELCNPLEENSLKNRGLIPQGFRKEIGA